MTIKNRAADSDASTEGVSTDAHAVPDPQDLVIGREPRRERRFRRKAERKAERKARRTRARARWVALTVDARLPEQVRDRVPGWAATGSGRILLAVLAVVALFVWALVFIVIVGL